MDYEPLEDYTEIAAEPMDFDLYFDLFKVAKAAAEGTLRVLPPDCECDPETLRDLPGKLDTPHNQIMMAVCVDCSRRFPEDTEHLLARRFLARFNALARAIHDGLLTDHFIQLEPGAEPSLSPAATMAAAASHLQYDGTFEPDEYLANIRVCQKVIENEWPEAREWRKK